MASLRRYYHRHFGYHGRFHLAVILTIVLVAYILVPQIARFVDSLGGYHPTGYEPKDSARWELLQRREGSPVTAFSWELLVNIGLFLAVAILWLTLVPTRASRRGPRGR